MPWPSRRVASRAASSGERAALAIVGSVSEWGASRENSAALRIVQRLRMSDGGMALAHHFDGQVAGILVFRRDIRAEDVAADRVADAGAGDAAQHALAGQHHLAAEHVELRRRRKP